jgi:hypothetical protein
MSLLIKFVHHVLYVVNGRKPVDRTLWIVWKKMTFPRDGLESGPSHSESPVYDDKCNGKRYPPETL